MRAPKSWPGPRQLLIASIYGFGLHALLQLDAFSMRPLLALILMLYVVAGLLGAVHALWRMYHVL